MHLDKASSAFLGVCADLSASCHVTTHTLTAEIGGSKHGATLPTLQSLWPSLRRHETIWLPETAKSSSQEVGMRRRL